MATKIDDKNNNNFVFEVRENTENTTTNHEMTVVTLLGVLQQNFAPTSDDETKAVEAASTTQAGTLTEQEAMKLLLKIVQLLQVWATDISRLKDSFGSDLGKINVDFMKQMSEISKRISEKQFQAFMDEKRKQEEAQRAQSIFSICIGVLAVLGNIMCGNVAGAVVAAVMLVATLPVFENGSTLLDEGKKLVANALESLGVDKQAAQFIADGIAFAIIACTLFAGSAGAASNSLGTVAKIAVTTCKYAGVILEAASSSGLVSDAVKAIVEECCQPTGNKAEDDAKKEMIATIVSAIVMILGIIFGGIANYNSAEEATNQTLIKNLAKVFGKNNFEKIKTATLFLQFFIPMIEGITRGVQSSQLAANKEEQADLSLKYAAIMSSKEFIESMSKLIDAMVAGDHKNLQNMLGLVEQMTQSILGQFGIYQKTAEVLG